jgi:hypothetical protein
VVFVDSLRSSALTEVAPRLPTLVATGEPHHEIAMQSKHIYITSSENVWRYYGGMIGGEKINAYLGTDFTRNTWDGWNFSA